MTEELEWGWYASLDGEEFNVGPEPTREAIINQAREDLDLDNDGFTIIEAKPDRPAHIKKWARVADILEAAEENIQDSLSPFMFDNRDIFAVTAEQKADLIARLERACDEWESAHGLVFRSPIFLQTRNSEFIPPLDKDIIE